MSDGAGVMLKKLFGFDSARHKVRTEIVAGVTTFLTMAYILAVNPGIFSAANNYGKRYNNLKDTLNRQLLESRVFVAH
jgi:xanthine/uracil/vitamin C permease (AzgA family)